MRTVAPEQIPFTFGRTSTEKTETSSTFLDNLSLPVHRWFRYSAGFSALWVRDLIRKEKGKGRSKVLDPFCGCGTVLLEGESLGVEAIGVEAHPFIARVARAKLHWRENPRVFRDYALAILQRAKKADGDSSKYAPLIHKCFPRGTLARLHSLRNAWEAAADGSPNSELTWLALMSILRETSPAGTAQWQYVLPKKAKTKVLDAYAAFESKVYLMSSDMAERQSQACTRTAVLYQEDARKCPSLCDGWADLVITSPPYTNNYDYADATRLEMTFSGDINGWGDLQETVRKYLLRSCTQHVAGLNGRVFDILNDPLVGPIHRELSEKCGQLEAEREKHGGRKAYHAMIAAYFHDMARVWVALRRVTREGSLACFVVGDSGPYGVYIPVDRWLGQLALAAGFKSHAFEKIRDRNVKWKNRKHRLPLQEGRLWVQG